MPSFRENILVAANGWKDYLALKSIDSSNPADIAIRVGAPAVLREWAGIAAQFKIVGSSGKVGTITNAPWIATFDRRITTSAMSGYYVTYLFSVDFQTVYLNIAFGINAFQERVGSGDSCYKALRKAADEYSRLVQVDDPRIARGEIRLGATKDQARHFAYQFSSIFSIKYDIAALPSDEVLRDDYLLFLRIYDQLVSTPTIPGVEEVVDALADAPQEIVDIVATKFEPRIVKSRGISGGRGANNNLRRSKLSQKIGQRGEVVVLEYEKKRLAITGKAELASQIVWTASQNEFPGWDITSFNEDGSQRFIEVKASTGDQISCLELTINEWKAAAKKKLRDQYFIYIVTNVFSANPRIEILQNPFAEVEKGRLSIEPSIFVLSLFRRES